MMKTLLKQFIKSGIMLFLCFYMTGAYAQRIAVTGKVTDEQGITLPGVGVKLEGTTTHTTVTDGNGNYSFTNLPADSYSLSFTYIGFAKTMQQLTVRDGENSVINVSLKEESNTLNEVVVVGYGTQKKVNLTGSISTVNAEDIENRPVTSSSQALQGVQGLYVNQAGGQPGRDNATIRVRGIGTLNNNNPLVLVDGIEYALSDVNPNDIETISVLKDAASAAIYGNRAANGVVLVTTKSGKQGRSKIDYNTYIGSQQVTYLPNLITNSVQYMELKNKALANESRLPEYSQTAIDEFKTGADASIYPNTNWFDHVYKDALIQQHNLRLSGGSEKNTYSLSMGYLDQDGVLIGSDAKKYSLRLNIKSSLTEKLSVGANLSGFYNDFNEGVDGTDRLTHMILRALPIHSAYLPDGRYGSTFLVTPGHNVFRNPIAIATEGDNNTKSQNYLANVFLEYKLPFDIRYKINGAINKDDALASRFVPDVFVYNPKTGVQQSRVAFLNPRSAQRINTSSTDLTFFNTLNWEDTLAEKHNITALVGFSREAFNDSDFIAYREGFASNDLTEIDAGSINPRVSGTSTRSTLMSYFGRLNYVLNNRYLFEANLRYDGSSRFAKDNRWGFFPSVSAGWRMSEEPFMQNIKWLDNLKLRASWGQLGNQQIGLFRYVNTINLGQDYSFGKDIASGAAVLASNDPNITWETTTISNLGIDADIFAGKLNFTGDVFIKRTDDILRAVRLPSQVGSLNGPIQNIGSVENRGYELGLSYRDQINKFKYNVGFSLTKIRNEVVELNRQTIFNGRFITQEGSPIEAYYIYEAEGIFQSLEEVKNHAFQTNNTAPGDIKYKDVDGNNIINGDDRQIRGGTIPEYTYSMNFGFNYSGFDIGGFFQGVQNIDTYPAEHPAFPFYNGAGATKTWLTNSWTPENMSAGLPRVTTSVGTPNYSNSTFWLKDASYLRLKNLQLGYTFPKEWINRAKIDQVRVFVNAQNLLTFSKMKDFDPEKDITKGTYYEYPSTKMFTAGLNFTF
ncbi:MAG TPA: TonB-dependent receptor [Sphingobacteriaceae bacterium]|nr:TonB-dependent receptor [Sphingobacteriaceae bacterium]